MIKLSICGAAGRMGVSICSQVEHDPEIELVGLLESVGHELLGNTVNSVEIISDMKIVVSNSDVVIDFSTPDTTLALLEICAQTNKAVVIGTTGFNAEQLEKIKKYSEKTAVFLSPNMSLGVNLIFKIASQITDNLKGYEKEIIEYHHNRKVDAPSGTAVKLAKMILRTGDKLIYGREGNVGPRDSKEVGVHAVRGGNIIGEHSVMWLSPYERVELKHRAESREVFASGSVVAAKWLHGQKAGRLYDMEDVIN